MKSASVRSKKKKSLSASLKDRLRNLPTGTVLDVARQTGIPPSSLSRFLNGSGLSLTHVDKLVSHFGIDVS